MRASRGACSIKSLQRVQEDLLGEILALLPVARQTIDEMEDQSPILLDQRFHGLGGRDWLHLFSW